MVSARREEATRDLGLLRREWYAAALSHEVGRKPRAVDVLGVSYVLYRDTMGRAVAHLDRCPYRIVLLSGGTSLQYDTLECPYHGWRFGPDGSCVKIPGLVTDLKKGQRVETFATCERYGLVWLCPEEAKQPDEGPLSLPEAEQGSHTV